MKCRIWKKLHAEEARRFDQAWTLAEKTPGLDLADAFGIVQSGMTVDEFSARRARSRKKEEIKEARASVQGAPIDGFINTLIAARAELSILLGERTVLDVIVAAHPVAFDLERSGKIEKLQVVLVARKGTWDRVSATVEREPKHTQKPAGVARQPSRRPVNDPRQFLDQVGKPITVALRNGIIVKDTLIAVGPFDVLLGTEGEEIFIPLHAMLTWSAA